MSLIHVTIQHGSILEVSCQGIVNAANSHGVMGGGVAGVIRRTAGKVVEKEAIAQAPIPVGEAILTSGGETVFQGIIHAPTMPEPAMRIPVRNVELATAASLSLADAHQWESLAFPGLGTGVGGISHQEAAAAMMKEISSFTPNHLQIVVLIDVDIRMVKAWQSILG